MRFLGYLAPLALIAAAPLVDEAPLSPAEATAIARATDLGALIYAYDQAAWHGTDDMIARIGAPDKKVGGWIVDGPAASPRIVFFDQSETDPRAVYTARFTGTRLTESALPSGAKATLTPRQKHLIAALRTAQKALAAAKVGRCVDKPFNTVLLPPRKAADPTLVYFLTPQTSTNELPLGGHYLVEVAADGVAGPVRAFTRTCLSVPIGAGSANREIAVTDRIDATPTELHVFSSLAAHLPILIASPVSDRRWLIDGNHISLIGKRR